MHALARRLDARDRRICGFIERLIRAGGFADDRDIAFDVDVGLERASGIAAALAATMPSAVPLSRD